MQPWPRDGTTIRARPPASSPMTIQPSTLIHRTLRRGRPRPRNDLGGRGPAPVASPRGRDIGSSTAADEGEQRNLVTASGRREGWRLLRATLAAQKRGIALGGLIGLLWSGTKIAVPLLVGAAINQAVDGHG